MLTDEEIRLGYTERFINWPLKRSVMCENEPEWIKYADKYLVEHTMCEWDNMRKEVHIALRGNRNHKYYCNNND